MVGSFLNVCIYRMPLGKSVVSPPSHCPHCNYSIPFYLNVPLVTWLMLRGKCKNCQAPISGRYFLVELLTGIMFLGCWLRYGQHSSAVALVMCLVMAGLIVATFIDLAHFIIPDEITIGGIVVGFLCSFAVPALHPAAAGRERKVCAKVFSASLSVGCSWKPFARRQTCLWPPETRARRRHKSVLRRHRHGAAGSRNSLRRNFLSQVRRDSISRKTRGTGDRCFLEADVALSPLKLKIGDEQFDPEQNLYMEAVTDKMVLPREAMGFGDVKFMAAIGAFLGWKATVFSLVVSSFFGAILGGLLILLKRHERANPIPYGPYIAAAAALWVFAGPPLMDWFWKRVIGMQ